MASDLTTDTSKSKRQQYEDRWDSLKADRETWKSHWEELSEYILPRRSRFLATDRNKGDKKNSRINDSTATLAARTCASGMLAGLTSPSRPWLRLTTPDPALAEWGPVKDWMFGREKQLYEIFARSNFYNSLGALYLELPTFGSASMFIEADQRHVIRCYPFTIGQFCLANSYRLDVDTMYREEELTAGQLVDNWGPRRVSESVMSAYRTGDTEKGFEVRHVIEPNTDRIPGRADFKNMPFRSVYYEVATGEEGRLLSSRGYQEWPCPSPRWALTGNDAYGGCPGMDALPDVKMLQLQQKRKSEAIDLIVRPPMVAPVTLKRQKASIVPGEITYTDPSMGNQKFEPAWIVNPNLRELKEDIHETQQRIKRAFYEDLFLMIAMSDRREITAREIDERHEEKLIMLGPVLERLQTELLDPVITRTLAIAMRAGLVPPPPLEVIQGGMKIEYISILAQAQRAVGVAAIEQLVSFAGRAARVTPQVIDKIDFDQAVDEYGQMVGVAPTVIRSDEETAGIRQQREQRAEQERQAAMAATAAKGAKDLSEARLDQGSALDRIIEGGIPQ